ncbi:MAG TPA: tripartite tricarboxylate transporter substrate binding protein [Microvirga sp.]|jgi:tripartite-type tricarboxylate transporter receptor subunit TctC|nr:tripartite tricarboxylate transporter substrate binding protein [Microvirga sp.]
MTRITRRTALIGAASAMALPAVPSVGFAAGYPEKPVRTIVPIAPGGQTDVLIRLLQLAIDKNKLLPQPLVIVNNAAAGGTAGTRLVRDAEPDGYTMGVFHMGLLTAPAMGVVDYDHSAFDLIGQVARTPIGLGVTADSRFKTIKDLLAEAKEKPDSVRVAMNIGLLPHFVPLMFQQDAGVQFRYVQSGGGAVRLKSLLGGHTDTSIFASSEFVLYKDQGIRPLVMFSESRVADLPDVPTAREIGLNTVFEERVMAFAPKGTPKDRIAVLAKALEASMNDPEVVERFKALGVERQFIPGDRLVGILDGLKGPITRVGDEVKKAQAANKP